MGEIDLSAKPFVPHDNADPRSPVRPVPGDPEDTQPPTIGCGLGLSGGGYRAMLFHLGALWRLNELGYLCKLTRISSVSGGSITSAMLGHAWSKLAFVNDVATAFVDEVVAPIRALAHHTIDVSSVISGALMPGVTIGDRIERAYRNHLFGDAMLRDLPHAPGDPRWVINAANVQTGVLFRFRQDYVADYLIGINKKAPSDIPLAKAVAASTAFAPILSPVVLDLDPDDFEPVAGAKLYGKGFDKTIVLTDGGNYDNLGLETIYKRCRTVLVSDAGNPLPAEPHQHRDWMRHGMRAIELLLRQITSLRKHQLLDALRAKERDGTYWGSMSHQAGYGVNDPLTFDVKLGEALATLPTRLQKLDDARQEALIDWGYVMCDTAMRRWVIPGPRPAQLPYPLQPL